MVRRALLATFGTLGDVYPFIAIAHTLATRGIDPVITAPEMFRGPIEGEGLAYAPLRPHETDILQALGVDVRGAFDLMLRNPHFILDEIYMRFLRETYADVLAAGAGADVLFTHSLLVGASQAAESLGVPCARVALAPLHLQSAAAPPATPGAPYCLAPSNCAALTYNRLVRHIVRKVTTARMGELRRFRAEVGLPATNEDFFLDFGRSNGADVVVGLYSPAFAPTQRDHPRNLMVPGFPFYAPRDPARNTLPADLARFLDDGAPPLVFTLGSFAPDVCDAFYEHSIAAAEVLGSRTVLLAGEREAARLAARASPRLHVCARAPHALLFPRARGVIHHGGIGTTAEAIRAGRPQLVVPFFGDQPDHGLRIERLGLGLTIPLARYGEATGTQALRRVLAGTFDEAARSYAVIIVAERGVEALADWAATAART